MRMISRKQALEIVRDHGWKPDSCVVMGSHKCLNGLVMTGDDRCESFNTSLGIHDTYAVIDVKSWLGY